MADPYTVLGGTYTPWLWPWSRVGVQNITTTYEYSTGTGYRTSTDYLYCTRTGTGTE